ncbi:MAG: 4Fe-4S dicluster domain-containing protein, partial [Deltaproteobacteria bacterium]|nr:4Fe-4S dicluster domain-containing protein [Deltaproteobacteria bacterium]
PWEIPRYSWEDSVPFVQKCDMCYRRVLEEGKPPACIEACPTKATIFGERDELLAEAHRRIEAEPDKYVQRVWGEKQVGGTSVLYISDTDLNLTDLDEPIDDETPMPQRTFKVLQHMPKVFVGVAATMGSIYWVIERRQRLVARNAPPDPPAPAKEEDNNGESADS